MKYMTQHAGERKPRDLSAIIFLAHDGRRMVRLGDIVRRATPRDLALWQLPVLALVREVRA